jgi:hypothetical protein
MIDTSQDRTPQGVPENTELGEDLREREEAKLNERGSPGPEKGNGDR